MEELTLTEGKGSLYLNGKLLVTRLEVEKYGIPAVELALLRRTESIPDALNLLPEARRLLKKSPTAVKGVSFLKGSSINEVEKTFVHHVLPLVDDKGNRHSLDLVRFGKTIYGIFIDGKIIATNGMAEEPKELVSEILKLTGKRLDGAAVERLNMLLERVANLKSSRDYVILTVAKNYGKRRMVA
ncbi:hypothetical protein DRN67_02610 [Candidatus Micrarchaeota archaeon]|nr:MAG: hypothetical protein DRN67_02610 [Candidatus Micrarchaeota archaeon]